MGVKLKNKFRIFREVTNFDFTFLWRCNIIQPVGGANSMDRDPPKKNKTRK